MKSCKFVFILGVAFLALSLSLTAGSREDSTAVFFQEEATPALSAVLASFVTQTEAEADTAQDGPVYLNRTAISVSNTLAVPTLEGVVFTGFPEGEDTMGPVWAFCESQAGESFVFNSAQDLDESGNPIGAGLTPGGMLPAGGTWTVFADEFLDAVGGGGDFIGYCYFVGEFDAIAGTYVNTFQLVQSQQAFPMQSDFSGVAVELSVTE